MENSIDWKTGRDLRKYFNSAERQDAKREILEAQELLLEDREIKTKDRDDLCRALDRKLNRVNYDLARTFHKLGVALIPGGEKMHFANTHNYDCFYEEWDYSNMSEDEILEMLALTTKQDYVIDLNHAIKYANFTWWDDEYY